MVKNNRLKIKRCSGFKNYGFFLCMIIYTVWWGNVRGLLKLGKNIDRMAYFFKLKKFMLSGL